MRVLRVYHAGRDPAHRRRDRALAAAGVDLTLVVPSSWPDAGSEAALTPEPFRVVELAVRRAGDVNRHSYADSGVVERLLADVRPDLVDLHEEPVSLVARQWLRRVGRDRPVVMYTAQNVDKRFPPPFAQYERAALARVGGLYPCSRQAASVARGKGFAGPVAVLPLGFDPSVVRPGSQSLGDDVVRLGLVGRLVPEKGVRDAVGVLAAVRTVRPAVLHLVGAGPEVAPALALAASLGAADAVEVTGWQDAAGLAALYRALHVVLVPSRATETWVEQFGRVIVEGQASGAVVAGYASGSIPEVAGAAAVVVPEGDVGGLAAAVVRVLTDPSEFGRRRTAGVVGAAGRTWAEVARGQVALYERVLGGSAGEPPSRLRSSSERHEGDGARKRSVLDRRREEGRRRDAARAEFGPPAMTPAGERPFAVRWRRVIRRGG